MTPTRSSYPHRFPLLGSPGFTGLCSCLPCRETVYAVPLVDEPMEAVLVDPGACDRTWLRRVGIPLRFAADGPEELRGHECCAEPPARSIVV